MRDKKSISYKDMAGVSDEDNVWFSFIVFESKAHRDEVNANVMKEMEESFGDQAEPFEMPNDMTKMADGGFAVAVEG